MTRWFNEPDPSSRLLARNGDTVHRTTCRFAEIGWEWADTATNEELHAAINTVPFHVCEVCQPVLHRSYQGVEAP